jgi:hypothetical protein
MCFAPGRGAFCRALAAPSGGCHVAGHDTHHHPDYLPPGRFSGRFRGYGYGLGHSGMGLGGVILIVLVILVLLGKF